MGGEQRVAWDLIRPEVPWLMESDRALVEIGASIRARLMAGEEVGVSGAQSVAHVHGADGRDSGR